MPCVWTHRLYTMWMCPCLCSEDHIKSLKFKPKLFKYLKGNKMFPDTQDYTQLKNFIKVILLADKRQSICKQSSIAKELWKSCFCWVHFISETSTTISPPWFLGPEWSNPFAFVWKQCILPLLNTQIHIPTLCTHLLRAANTKGGLRSKLKSGHPLGFYVTKTNDCNVTHHEKEWVGHRTRDIIMVPKWRLTCLQSHPKLQ